MFFLRYYLWVAPHVILALVLLLSIWKKLWKTLPIFFAFAAFELLQFIVLFMISRPTLRPLVSAYRWTLFIGSDISSLLQLGAVFELAYKLILSHPSLGRGLRRFFSFSLAGFVMVAAVLSGALVDISHQRVVNLFQLVDFCSSLIAVGMLVALFLLSRVLALSWRHWSIGVALGFGVSAATNLAAAAFRSVLGQSGFIGVDIVQMAAFHAAVLIWLAYLLLPEKTPTLGKVGFRASDLQFWNQELQRITRP